MKINFYPDSNLNDYSQSVKDFEDVWQADGEKIIETLEKSAELKFKETFINAIVYHRKSFCYPLSLRSGMPKDRVKSVLVHELGHRLIYGTTGKREDDLTSHKNLFLFLYDAFVELYGEEFAKDTVAWDSNLAPFYKEAWEWALNFSPADRQKEFGKLLSSAQS